MARHDPQPRHGYSSHPLYYVYNNMMRRCYDPESDPYENYGGRGIRVCPKWKSNRIAFIEWALANGWAPGLALDRRDNNGNYTPKNCRFVTYKVNNNNTRSNRRVTYNGETATLTEISEKYAVVGMSTVGMRLSRGWTLHDALKTPSEKKGRQKIPIPKGIRFGMLTVIKEVEQVGYIRKFRCKCDCGKKTTAILGNLRAGTTRSCGCLKGTKNV